MQKITLKIVFSILIAFGVIIFDVFIIVGWAFSLLYCGLKIYQVKKFYRGNLHQGGFHLKLSIFVIALTSIIGYSSVNFIEKDFMKFAQKIGKDAPRDKKSLLLQGEKDLAWITKFSLLSYANMEGHAIAKFRVFPYKIGEYDFVKGRFIKSSYD